VNANIKILPLALTSDLTVRSLAEMANAILAESDHQVADKDLQDESAVADFQISCDALNYWRLYRRVCKELGLEDLDGINEKMLKDVALKVCAKRDYSWDDFLSAQLATAQRVRVPWGYTSLRLAYSRALQRPIKLLTKDLQDAPVPSIIAAIALELSRLERQKDGLIFLPINSLRAMLRQRKIVVSGAVTRLMLAGIISAVNEQYSRGKAREFRFTARLGVDYKLLYEEKTADGTA
jgi:hypothetical protein